MAEDSSDSISTTLDSDPPQSDPSPSLSRNLSASRLNAKAPEFVPRSNSMDRNQQQQQAPLLYHQPPGSGFFHARVPVQNHRVYPHQVPVQYHHHPTHHQPQQLVQAQVQGGAVVDSDHGGRNGGLTEEATQKILNQVEYYFSDVNLGTTEHLMRFISKDPEGYVPISVVSSFKKIKALISSNSQLASILRTSAKLAVSEDGKKVRRQLPLTESDMKELQSRIVVAENLPEDHCHQNLMKIFSAVGSVKSIRTCQPQPQPQNSGGGASGSRQAKSDGMLYSSNKLHAFVEYESVELAEKAVAELNEEGNWRNGLKLCLLRKRSAKSAQSRVKKVGHEGEAHRKEDEASTMEQQDANEKHLEDSPQQSEAQPQQSHEHGGEEQTNDKEGIQKKGRSRGGRGKGRGRPQYHHNNNHNSRGNHVGTPPSVHPINSEHQPVVTKQPPGPRMPDGTRGFSMGRGKPVAINIG